MEPPNKDNIGDCHKSTINSLSSVERFSGYKIIFYIAIGKVILGPQTVSFVERSISVVSHSSVATF